MSLNTTKHTYKITRTDREIKHGHKSFFILFTGLSGSGKSTLASLLEFELYKQNISTYVLDGDNIRQGINKDLTFVPKDRSENLRRIAEIGNLLIEAGVLTLAAFVSPNLKDRELIKKIVGKDNFVEIFVNTSLEECERRDVKGLYKKARLGKIKNMTGISAPYEPPLNPDFEIKTENQPIEDSVKELLTFLNKIIR
jgi:adenylylsulfate kinase